MLSNVNVYSWHLVLSTTWKMIFKNLSFLSLFPLINKPISSRCSTNSRKFRLLYSILNSSSVRSWILIENTLSAPTILSWVEHRGPTVGCAFHEKLIKRSEIAGFMGTSHKERIALNHNNECSNKPSEKYAGTHGT